MPELFQVASISKQFAAACVLSLADSGVLDLHAPIGRWVPEAAEQWRSATLHELLSHTSGMDHWGAQPGFDVFDGMDASDRIAHFLRSERLTRTWRFSSPGYVEVGHVIERATGHAYADALGDVFSSLPDLPKLANTSVGPKPAGAVDGHDGGTPLTWQPITLVGTSDIWSTESDIEAWTRTLHNGPLAERMIRPHTAVPGASSADDWLRQTGYGYGLSVGWAGDQPAIYHTGDVPGFRTLALWLPQQRRAVAVLANDEDADVVAAARARVEIGPDRS